MIFKKIIDIVTSFGAAIVIFGAWAKLLHKSYADILLTIGLLTEATIFILYGILAFFEQERTPAEGSGSNTDELNKTLKRIFRSAIIVGIIWLCGCSPKYGCDATKGKVFYNMHNIKK